MKEYPFPHHGPVYLIQDGNFEIAYYSRDKRKFRRIRDKDFQTWQQTKEQEVEDDMFWCVIALAEMRGSYA